MRLQNRIYFKDKNTLKEEIIKKLDFFIDSKGTYTTIGSIKRFINQKKKVTKVIFFSGTRFVFVIDSFYICCCATFFFGARLRINII